MSMTYLALATGGGAEVFHDVPAAGAAYEVDPADGNVQRLTLDAADCTLTFVAPLPHAGAGVVHAITLLLVQDATGNRTVTWPASVKWPSAAGEPTLTGAAASIDVVTLLTPDDGATWLAFVAGLDMQ